MNFSTRNQVVEIIGGTIALAIISIGMFLFCVVGYIFALAISMAFWYFPVLAVLWTATKLNLLVLNDLWFTALQVAFCWSVFRLAFPRVTVETKKSEKI